VASRVVKNGVMASAVRIDSVDRPRLTADFSGEPAGKDRNEGEWKLRKVSQSRSRLRSKAVPETQIGTQPGEPQHNHGRIPP